MNKDPIISQEISIRNCKFQAKLIVKKICMDISKVKEYNKDINIHKEYLFSQRSLNNYVVLDPMFLGDIMKIKEIIRRYSSDRTLTRPLNFIMLADPGTGKSFFVDCLALALSDYGLVGVDCNISTLRDIGDMVPAIETLRNHKIGDKLPILLLDEFDALKDMSPFLPLLWDGILSVGHLRLRIGKAIIILAGSKPEVIDYLNSQCSIREHKNESCEVNLNIDKFGDLLSRINGGYIRIPSLKNNNNGDSNDFICRANKICITIAVLRARFGRRLTYIPWALLRFVAEISFKHNIRSIVTLINGIRYEPTSPINDRLPLENIKTLPLNNEDEFMNSCIYQHIEMGAEYTCSMVVRNWKEYCQVDTMVSLADEGKLLGVS